MFENRRPVADRCAGAQMADELDNSFWPSCGKSTRHSRSIPRVSIRSTRVSTSSTIALRISSTWSNTPCGLASLNATRMRALEARHDASQARRRGMDERLDQLERRLSKVEEKLGG
jgi:hypothetical protein